ncbi:Conserved TM helix [Spirosomataceae bacterium TFI 002]|nr:Conserved TM helix [Spirosomataceae bacterium TFI 002]
MTNLNQFTANLSETFGNLIPGVFGAIILIIIGFLLARLIKSLILKLMTKFNVDEKLGFKPDSPFRLDKFLSILVYYIVLVYTLLIALNMLGVTSALQPLQTMLNEFVGYLPNVIGAGVIIFAGYILSKLGSEAVGFLSEQIESFGKGIGLSSGLSLSKIVKQVVFISIFIPLLIFALDTLNMTVISGPATEMLQSFLMAVPKIIAAAILLAVFYIVGKYVVSILTELLSNVGVDTFSENIGLKSVIGSSKLSTLLGNIALFFIIFTGTIAAAGKLELTEVQEILTNIFNISGKIFFGLVILMLGVFVSNIAAKALAKTQNSGALIPILRFAVIGIFLAFSLHTMGIAESIVNLAFGLTLGAVAVAFALSFGLGGREAAGKQMQEFFDNMKKKK